MRQLPVSVLIVSVVCGSSRASAQDIVFDDDFENAQLSDYFLVDPIGSVIGAPNAEFSLENGGFRVLANVTPDVALGAARAGFEFLQQPTPFTDFSVTVDVVDWDETALGVFGATARTRDLNLSQIGTLDGYYAGLSHTGGLVIGRLDDEVPTVIAEADLVVLDANADYRISFTGDGPDLTAQLHSLDDLSTSLASITVSDNNYKSGNAGLLAASLLPPDAPDLLAPNAIGDATFDNYSLVATSVPEPTTLSLVGVLAFMGVIVYTVRRSR